MSGPIGGKKAGGSAARGNATRKNAARGNATRKNAARGNVPRKDATRATASSRPATMLRLAGAARAATIALPLPLTPPFKSKRAPNPDVRRNGPAQPRVRETQPRAGLARRAGTLAASLPGHPWLDRVVRGRAWIPLLGVLLAGIVAAQVEILKLGASMGRALEQTTTLTTQNEQLRGSVAGLADDQRIERLAAAMGLVLPPPGAVGYIHADRDGNVNRALANLRPPDPAAFVALAPANGALVTGPGTSTLPPPAGTPPPATTTSSTTGATTATTSQTPSTGTTSQTPSTGTTSQTASTGTTSQTSVTTAAPATATTPSTGPTTPQAPAATLTAPQVTQAPTATPPTGAAAIQPAGTIQQSSGG
ncbi:MAG: hypothetical protein JO304_01325 [Solirubrobacterales bacterium]|nr:hypothetical protein [Solirubrobacterales bacterium]